MKLYLTANAILRHDNASGVSREYIDKMKADSVIARDYSLRKTIQLVNDCLRDKKISFRPVNGKDSLRKKMTNWLILNGLAELREA